MPNVLSRIFSKKTPHVEAPVGTGNVPAVNQEVDSQAASINEHYPESPDELATRAGLTRMLVGYAQSIGIKRDTNEDSLFTLTSSLNSNGLSRNFGLYLIADGMGGHEAGEVASRIAIEKTSTYVLEKMFLPSLSITNQPLNISIQEVLRDGAIHAHQAIKHAMNGSGTTLTAALVLDDQVTIAHIGDSRAYIIEPDWRMVLLTHDHSLVKRLEEIGQLTAEEASHHPKRNLLYRALGQGDQVEPEVTSYHIFPGQMLLLCTDGLWGVVPEADIVELIQSSGEPQGVCQSLIDSANAAGGPDNISVILVRFPG